MSAQWEDVKWVPGTNFIVDGFRFTTPRCRHYFLTHAHGDHTTGLYKSWAGGTIYCTHVTANLLTKEQGIHPARLRRLDMDKAVQLMGVTITPLDANHCPGACMFLFEVPLSSGGVERILHTGDFRYSPHMGECSVLRAVRIDTLLLDTTYAAPRWTFPSQDEAIDSMVRIMREQKRKTSHVLFACNAYHIGKEKCYFSAAVRSGFRVWVNKRRRGTLELLDLPRAWLDTLVTDAARADIVINDGGVNPPQLAALAAEWRRPVVGFRCTGWSFQKRRVSKREQDGTVSFGIPYSEHSSWSDLRACVKRFQPTRLIPTVNVHDKKSMEAMIGKFADLMDLSKSLRHMDRFVVKGKRSQPDAATPGDAQVENAPQTVAIQAKGARVSISNETCSTAAHCLERDEVMLCHASITPWPCQGLRDVEIDICSHFDLSDDEGRPAHPLAEPELSY